MILTNNLKLEKPEKDDIAGWQNFNNNSDILDKEITNIYDKLGGKDAETLTEIKERFKVIPNVSLYTSNWRTYKNIYSYKYSHKDITASSIVNVNIDVNDLENAKMVLSATNSFDGYVMLYAQMPPRHNLRCDITISKEVK